MADLVINMADSIYTTASTAASSLLQSGVAGQLMKWAFNPGTLGLGSSVMGGIGLMGLGLMTDYLYDWNSSDYDHLSTAAIGFGGQTLVNTVMSKLGGNFLSVPLNMLGIGRWAQPLASHLYNYGVADKVNNLQFKLMEKLGFKSSGGKQIVQDINTLVAPTSQLILNTSIDGGSKLLRYSYKNFKDYFQKGTQPGFIDKTKQNLDIASSIYTNYEKKMSDVSNALSRVGGSLMFSSDPNFSYYYKSNPDKVPKGVLQSIYNSVVEESTDWVNKSILKNYAPLKQYVPSAVVQSAGQLLLDSSAEKEKVTNDDVYDILKSQTALGMFGLASGISIANMQRKKNQFLSRKQVDTQHDNSEQSRRIDELEAAKKLSLYKLKNQQGEELKSNKLPFIDEIGITQLEPTSTTQQFMKTVNEQRYVNFLKNHLLDQVEAGAIPELRDQADISKSLPLFGAIAANESGNVYDKNSYLNQTGRAIAQRTHFGIDHVSSNLAVQPRIFAKRELKYKMKRRNLFSKYQR